MVPTVIHLTLKPSSKDYSGSLIRSRSARIQTSRGSFASTTTLASAADAMKTTRQNVGVSIATGYTKVWRWNYDGSS